MPRTAACLLLPLAVLAPRVAAADDATPTAPDDATPTAPGDGDARHAADARDPAAMLPAVFVPRPFWALADHELALHADLVVRGDGEGTRGGVDVGAELAWRNRRCTLLAGGARASATRALRADRAAPGDDDRQLAGESWLRGCLALGLGLPTIELAHHGQLAARPALSAPWRVRALDYSAGSFELGVSFLDLDLGAFGGEPGLRLEIMRAAPRVTIVRDAPDHAWSELAARVDTLRVTVPRDGEDLEVGALRMDIASVDDERTAEVMSFTPVALRGVRAGALRLDAELAWTHASLWDPASTTIDPVTGLVAPVREEDLASGRVALRGGVARVDGGVELSRGAWPSSDDELVVETRASAHLGHAGRKLGVRIQGFVARTRRLDADTTSATTTGGAQATVQAKLSKHLSISLSAEAARSFYVPGEGPGDELAPAPAWGAQGFMAISGTWRSSE